MHYSTVLLQPCEALILHVSVLSVLLWCFYYTLPCTTLSSLFCNILFRMYFNVVVMYSAPYHVGKRALTGQLS